MKRLERLGIVSRVSLCSTHIGSAASYSANPIPVGGRVFVVESFQAKLLSRFSRIWKTGDLRRRSHQGTSCNEHVPGSGVERNSRTVSSPSLDFRSLGRRQQCTELHHIVYSSLALWDSRRPRSHNRRRLPCLPDIAESLDSANRGASLRKRVETTKQHNGIHLHVVRGLADTLILYNASHCNSYTVTGC